MNPQVYPKMFRVRQHFDSPTLTDVSGEIERQLARLNLGEKVKAGESVAITVGSRGIANIRTIVADIIEHCRQLDATPFIVPAMGSHGGASVEGQLKILAGYGITPENMGVEIRATMDTVVVAETEQKIPVHFDRHAADADHVIVCNRIKPHTGFVGPIESGLHKMMLIGLGNHNGAKLYHQAIANYTFGEIIKSVGDLVIQKCGVLCGVAIVENSHDETGLIEAVQPSDFFTREPVLLQQSKDWLPGLPFRDVDLLIVDRIGKNVSGTGMDSNVVGRKYNDHIAMEDDSARCTRILVRGLTAESHGNATGIGMAEFTTQACVDQIDRDATNVNCVTGNHPEAGMIPLVYPTDAVAVATAMQTIGMRTAQDARVVQIADTLHVAESLVSEVFLDEVGQRDNLEQIGELAPMVFDNAGNLANV